MSRAEGTKRPVPRFKPGTGFDFIYLSRTLDQTALREQESEDDVEHDHGDERYARYDERGNDERQADPEWRNAEALCDAAAYASDPAFVAGAVDSDIDLHVMILSGALIRTLFSVPMVQGAGEP